MFLESHIDQPMQKGCIEVICGSMFSGKTEELIRRLKRAEFAKLKTAVFKPQLDVRYDNKHVVSHDSNTIVSTPVSSPSEILDLANDSEVVAIDEAQFFNTNLVDVCNKLANQGKRVIIAGLDMDFLGKPFGAMPKILAIAEHITKVHAICIDCGEIANHSFRLNKNKDLVQLGQKDEYKPLCRQCFVNNI
ncbi:MAG: thymidine kinase [Flavobacteriales bacterium]|nr:thymidine kinase [Flavobacteriales bacterium]|tara:strand:- start:1189 stop:1761 length:573 start_codon:yes stop_codon:yes gene_type:complete